MNRSNRERGNDMKRRRLSNGMFLAGLALSAIVGAYPAADAHAAIVCEREVTADVVVIDAIPKTSVGKFDKKVLREQFKDYLWPEAS